MGDNMGIIGLTYDKITTERTEISNKKVNINTTSSIKNIEKSELNAFNSKVKALNIKFELKSKFKPKIGFIDIEGTVIYTAENIEEIMKQWKKNKTVPDENRVELTNYIFRNALPKALLLTDIMQLPPVLDIPQARLKK